MFERQMMRNKWTKSNVTVEWRKGDIMAPTREHSPETNSSVRAGDGRKFRQGARRLHHIIIILIPILL